MARSACTSRKGLKDNKFAASTTLGNAHRHRALMATCISATFGCRMDKHAELTTCVRTPTSECAYNIAASPRLLNVRLKRDGVCVFLFHLHAFCSAIMGSWKRPRATWKQVESSEARFCFSIAEVSTMHYSHFSNCLCAIDQFVTRNRFKRNGSPDHEEDRRVQEASVINNRMWNTLGVSSPCEEHAKKVGRLQHRR